MATSQLSNPFSTGGGGASFEARVHASFAALMLTGGSAPTMPRWTITKLQMQAKQIRYATDDLVVFTRDPATARQRRLLVQIKHRIGINQARGSKFPEVIEAAWADFSDSTLFTEGEDQIALITGPISSTDHEVRELLDWSRTTLSADEFVRKVNLTGFSSDVKRQKLECFRSALSGAKGEPITDDELYRFLRHFHLLGYDLDLRFGVTLSLLHSLIGQYSPENAQMLWSRLVDEMESLNLNGGAVTRDTIAEDVRDVFVARPVELIPAELSFAARPEPVDWSGSPQAAALAHAVILGGWDETKEADTQAIETFVGVEYGTWIAEIRKVLVSTGSPMSLSDGKWKVVDRQQLWADTASLLFDDDLSRLGTMARTVLGERDPQFDLPPGERYAAAVHGKTLAHSRNLREGVAGGLALVGSRSGDLLYGSRRKAVTEVAMTVRDLLTDADGLGWAGLNDVLPSLAEASPDEFIAAVESALQADPCPFDAVFAQEADGITGRNYMTGLLWGLEALAWDPNFLVRVVVALGDLSRRDPGGTWANRPENSIRAILLPWLPQTLAPVEKRLAAVKTLSRESPDVAWSTLLGLLPNQHQTSSGSFKPVWRETIPDDWEKGVSGEDYWAQVGAYSDLAVTMADGSLQRMKELVDCLPSLPRPAFDAFLTTLGSPPVTTSPEAERVDLWEALVGIANKHAKYAHTDWALPSEAIERIEKVAAKLAPEDEYHRYRRLFTGRDFDLFESTDLDKERQRLDAARRNALGAIIGLRGVDGVVEFSATVDARWQVGRILGMTGNQEFDEALLPRYLDSPDDGQKEMTAAYCRSRFAVGGWDWIDGIDRSAWTSGQQAWLLASVPFVHDAWTRAESWLGKDSRYYWDATPASPYEVDEQHDRAAEELLQHGRPMAALHVLHWHLHESQEINERLVVRALVDAVSSKESSSQLDAYEMVELIKALQERAPTIDELPAIEWAYLPILDGTHGATPVVLDRKLATDPAFFMEVVRRIYRSKDVPKAKRAVSEQERTVGLNAWRLLHRWRLVPGTGPSGGIDGRALRSWLKAVRKSAKESGHLEVAMTHIGHVFYHSPPDSGGLWVDQSVAEAVNASDAERIRSGYYTEAINARGVYTVDPSGKPERELADDFRAKADAVENAGYQRFAITLRRLADSYDEDATRIIEEHRQEEEWEDGA